MSPESRGWDITVTVASKAETKLFHNAIEAARRSARPHTGAEKALSPEYPIVYKSQVTDISLQKGYREMLHRAPFYAARATNGRGTRVYCTYDLHDEMLRTLKDTWAVVDDKLLSEVQAIKTLQDAGVPFLPKVICGGDVMSVHDKQVTIVQKWAKINTQIMQALA